LLIVFVGFTTDFFCRIFLQLARQKPDAMQQTPSVSIPLADPSLPVHEALTLMQGGTKAFITANGQVYTLRITRQGKLILTK